MDLFTKDVLRIYCKASPKLYAQGGISPELRGFTEAYLRPLILAEQQVWWKRRRVLFFE